VLRVSLDELLEAPRSGWAAEEQRGANRASYASRGVIWRFVILAPYVVLAAVVAAAYGVQGFATLMYFYFVAGAWLIFVLAWGSLARRAGRLNAERVWRTGRWSMGRPSSSG
jgi:hypothetical protein